MGQTCRQILSIGAGSQSVVILTGGFTGAVFTAQVYSIFKDFQVESASGGLVSLAMCRELAPVLVALMITGRVGASIAAEIGTMKVTEQIDALRAMAVDPVEYLVVPRLLAMMISIPLLIAESIACGIFAAYAVGVVHYGIPEAAFMRHLNDYTAPVDIYFGMIKGFIFGLIIVMVACQRGLTAEDGAVGVGKSTTSAVVTASLIILISNFFLTMLLTPLMGLD
ncbi:MAG: phospholipid/cholesterol/gamma-HCH transport system permease protein [Pseudoalteromonas tetraodonis]|jgi:phospholipid/cholesterol/gamma-HCH transport system permease protein